MHAFVWLYWVGFLWMSGPFPAMAREETPPYTCLETPLPYRVAWGPYTITVEAAGKDQRIGNRMRITNRAGRVLREIDAYFLDVDFPRLDGRDSGLLRVTTEPGNNTLANCRTYCFTRRGTLRNVLVMPSGFDQLRDLDHDGQPELIGDNPAPLEWIDDGGLCHAACPPVYLILRWNGARYTSANRRFPAAVLAEVAEKKNQFLAYLEKYDDPQSQFSSDYLVGDALGIWADLASVGRQHEAQRWLLPRLPNKFMRQRFLAMVPDARKRLAKLPAQVRTDQSSRILAPSIINETGED